MNAHMMTSESARTATVADLVSLRRGGDWSVVLDLAGGTGDRGLRTDAINIDSWWRQTFTVLDAPDRMLEVRSFSADTVTRICAARRGDDQVIALRAGTQVSIRQIPGGALSVTATRIRRLLGDLDRGAERVGPGSAPAFAALRYPAADLADRLADCSDPHALTDTLYALGASPSDANRIAAALTRCHRRTEIVAVAGRVTSAGAVGILDSDRGRILASPSLSADGQVWTTVSPGSDHRIEQAIALLVETLPDGWGQ